MLSSNFIHHYTSLLPDCGNNKQQDTEENWSDFNTSIIDS